MKKNPQTKPTKQINKRKRKQKAQGKRGKRNRDGSFINFKAQNGVVTSKSNCWEKITCKSIISGFVFLKE